jgi:1-acyl-sn-glycerol-3-phosphate acyltransferase
MRRAMPGIAYIVEQTHVPVVPAALVGTTEDFWQRAKRGERPSLEIRIGKPIILPDITAKGNEKHEARQNNADLVMRHLAGLLPGEYRGVYAGSAIFPS